MTEAREAVDIPVTMERIPWNEMNQPREPAPHMPPIGDPPPEQPEFPMQPEVQETPRDEKNAPKMVQDGPFLLMPNVEQQLPAKEKDANQVPENLLPVPSHQEQNEPFLPASGSDEVLTDQPVALPMESNAQEQKEKTDALLLDAPALPEEHLTQAPDHETPSNLGGDEPVEQQPPNNPFHPLSFEEQHSESLMPFPSADIQESMGRKQPLPVQDGAGNASSNMPPSFSDQPNEQRGIPVNP